MRNCQSCGKESKILVIVPVCDVNYNLCPRCERIYKNVKKYEKQFVAMNTKRKFDK